MSGFDLFRQEVLKNPQLQAKLRDISDLSLFASQLVQLGREHGYTITEHEIEAAIRESQRTWCKRWL